jgi:COP9 signalosome complex subunit 5
VARIDMPFIPICPMVMDKILWLDSRIKLTDVTLHIFPNSHLFVTMAADQGSVVQGGEPHPSTAPAPQQLLTAENARYSYDEEKLRKLKSDAPWMKNPKYFNAVAVSPTAVMKIMMHCQSGVDKGIAKGGNPIEVMGLLLGRPDPTTPETLVVTDAFPLPIEGFETRVVADDENVSNHMIALGDVLEITRKEHFMGWYHSHPFDLGENSHCFLSQTDLSTQLQWQRAEDPHGNPFVAIVVDPLRSLHTGTPELKAFRAYPPEYTSAQFGECPDGSVEAVEQQRLELWGSCWNRYYELVRIECST